MLENDNSYAQSPGLTQINKQMIEQIHNINLMLMLDWSTILFLAFQMLKDSTLSSDDHEIC